MLLKLTKWDKCCLLNVVWFLFHLLKEKQDVEEQEKNSETEPKDNEVKETIEEKVEEPQEPKSDDQNEGKNPDEEKASNDPEEESKPEEIVVNEETADNTTEDHPEESVVI